MMMVIRELIAEGWTITSEDLTVLAVPDRPHPALRRLRHRRDHLPSEAYDAHLGVDPSRGGLNWGELLGGANRGQDLVEGACDRREGALDVGQVPAVLGQRLGVGIHHALMSRTVSLIAAIPSSARTRRSGLAIGGILPPSSGRSSGPARSCSPPRLGWSGTP